MIFSQKITERGKPDPSECMSFLTARNLVSRIHRICFWPSRVFGSSSDHIRAFCAALSRWPKRPKTVGTRLFRWTKGNAGSGEENDSKCRQDRSGRPARVVKPWGGGGFSIVFRGHIEWKFISHFTKKNLANEVYYESQFKSERVYFTWKKTLKAQIPFTTHWHFAMFALINCSSWKELSVDKNNMTRLWARIGSVLKFISLW